MIISIAVYTESIFLLMSSKPARTIKMFTIEIN